MNSSGTRPSWMWLNPFRHSPQLTALDKIKIGLMSVTVFPIRLLLVAFFMLLAWPFAFVAIVGRSEGVVEPQTWWRRLIDFCLRAVMRAMWFCGGFHWIKVKGERASPAEAPIITVAPHSAYFDAIPVTMTMCSLVTKLESRSVPLWGTLISYIRPVLVFRSDPESRRKTVAEIQRRAGSGGEWPQVMIYPEGTCTNRSGLIQFKPGAFIPGLPVQPVVLRYPNRLDTFTWTWQGPGGFKILWMTLCQFYTNLEIEFLPVYTPSEAEKQNPTLFANNVRKVMAKALELPLLEISLEDRDICFSRGPLCIFDLSSLLEFNQLVGRLGLRSRTSDQVLEELASHARELQGKKLSVSDFAHFLSLPPSDTLGQVHCLFDQSGDGLIDIRHYVIALSTVRRPSRPMETLRMAFKMYETESRGEVEEEDLASILEIMLGVRDVSLDAMLIKLDRPLGQKISFDDFANFLQRYPGFVHYVLDFKNHPRHLCAGRRHFSNGQNREKGKKE